MGIDGYGCLDLCVKLCSYFGVDVVYIVVVILKKLVDEGEVDVCLVKDVIFIFELDMDCLVVWVF